MIEVRDKEKCCGCSACVQACPKHCISFGEDNEGFRYPLVNKDICVDCHICEKVCPVINSNDPKEPIEILSAYNKNEKIRIESSSGGIFTLLAEDIIEQGGVVFGARFDENWEVCHDYTDTIEGLASFRGSKYLQSRIENSYIKAKEFLQNGRKVLFSGTPCQIAGLNRFLGKKYQNLITVDFACHGVPSPKVWRKYLKEVKYKSYQANKCSQFNNLPEITGINFRDKISGWKNYSFTINLDGISEKGSKGSIIWSHIFWHDPFMKAFLNNLVLRPSCYHCTSKHGRSGSDITISDWWGIKEYQRKNEIDDDKGLCVVMLNSTEGQSYFDKFEVEKLEISMNEATPCNGGFHEYIIAHPQRESFFKMLDSAENLGGGNFKHV